MKRIIILVFVGLMLCAAAPSSDLIYPGDWSSTNSELKPEDYSFPGYKDTYVNDGIYSQIRFDDGGYMFAQFFIYKAGPLWRYGELFTYVETDGTRKWFKEEVPDAKVQQKGPPFFWRENESTLSGDGANLHWVIKCQGLEADLRYKRLTPGWKAGDGKARLNAQKNIYFKNVVICPAARVEGTIKIDGKPRMAGGYAYLDRTVQTSIPTHYAAVSLSTYTMPDPKAPPEDRWFLHFLDNFSSSAYNNTRYPWLILIRNDKIVFTSKDFTVKQEDFRIDPSIGEKSPFRFVVNGRQGADTIQFATQGEKIIDSMDVFSQLPPYIKKFALTFLKRPVYFRISSTVKGTLHQNGQSIPFHSIGMSGTVYIK